MQAPWIPAIAADSTRLVVGSQLTLDDGHAGGIALAWPSQALHRDAMKHRLVTAALLLAALACYGIGLDSGATALLALGGIFELAFWARAFPGFGVLSRTQRRSPQ